MDADTLKAAFPVWTCRRGHVNDPLRNPCRYCGDHQPCDQAAEALSEAHCGARPTRAYPHGIRCARHALSGQEPHPTAGPCRSAVKVWPEREARAVLVADGRRPEINRWALGAPDKVRASVAKMRAAGWEVWTAALDDAGVGGRARVLMVAYRGAEMIVEPWDQGADLTWKAGKGSRWIGRVPDGAGQVSMTALMRMVTSIEPVPFVPPVAPPDPVRLCLACKRTDCADPTLKPSPAGHPTVINRGCRAMPKSMIGRAA